MSTSISIRTVTKTFAGSLGGRAAAVDNISLDINAGELFFLLGPSGCGKTTLLRMIAGFIEPTSGAILFSGNDITAVPPNKRNTGMVFQSYALWPHMTVEANVAFGLQVRKTPAAESAQRVREALAAVRMEEYAPRKPNQLSGGQQQRVALARALVIRPDVLLLDEPLSNLDARLRLELRAEIRRICKSSGITTVYVTHDQKEALSMADRIAVLNAGRIVQVGSPSELYRRPASRFVAEFLGETNLLSGTVTSVDEARTIVETGAGQLVAPSSKFECRQTVLCSIRPEAIRNSAESDKNTIACSLLESTYLGDQVQYRLKSRAGAELRAVAPNPDPDQIPAGEMSVAIEPRDVVLLPAGD